MVVMSGDQVSYTLSYYLSGASRSDIQVNDILPLGLDYVSSTPSGVYTSSTRTLTIKPLSLVGYTTGYITVIAQVKGSGSLTNTAVVGTTGGMIN